MICIISSSRYCSFYAPTVSGDIGFSMIWISVVETDSSLLALLSSGTSITPARWGWMKEQTSTVFSISSCLVMFRLTVSLLSIMLIGDLMRLVKTSSSLWIGCTLVPELVKTEEREWWGLEDRILVPELPWPFTPELKVDTSLLFESICFTVYEAWAFSTEWRLLLAWAMDLWVFGDLPLKLETIGLDVMMFVFFDWMVIAFLAGWLFELEVTLLDAPPYAILTSSSFLEERLDKSIWRQEGPGWLLGIILVLTLVILPI